MTSLTDARRMLRLGAFRQRRSEHALTQTRRQLQPIETQLQAFEKREHSLQALIVGQRPDGNVLGREQLLAFLRSQAVLRRQLHTMAIDRVSADQRLNELNRQLHGQLSEHTALQRKQDKYIALCERLERIRRTTMRYREDIENEDALLHTDRHDR